MRFTPFRPPFSAPLLSGPMPAPYHAVMALREAEQGQTKGPRGTDAASQGAAVSSGTPATNAPAHPDRDPSSSTRWPRTRKRRARFNSRLDAFPDTGTGDRELFGLKAAGAMGRKTNGAARGFSLRCGGRNVRDHHEQAPVGVNPLPIIQRSVPISRWRDWTAPASVSMAARFKLASRPSIRAFRLGKSGVPSRPGVP